MRRCFVQLTVFMLSVLVPGLVANAAGPGEPESIHSWPLDVTTSLEVRLEGDVVNTAEPCSETVHIDGTVQVVADVKQDAGPAVITIYIAMVDVQGVGATTGAKHLITGAIQQDIAVETLPTHVPFMATFAWISLGRCKLPPPTTAELGTSIELAFDAAGRLTPAESAAIAVPNFINYRNK